MASQQINQQRVKRLNDLEPSESGNYVLYWMQHSQRAEHNDALELAIQRANEHDVPVLVAFGLTEDYPDGSLRHFRFMLEGLSKTADAIRRRGIGFVLRLGSPERVAIELAEDAVEVITDRGYLRHHRDWREIVAQKINVRLTQVECDLVVPIEVASDKREYAARTIRSKINDAADDFMHTLATTAVECKSSAVPDGEPTDDVDGILDKLTIDRSVEPISWMTGGTAEARSRLNSFCEEDLTGYDGNRGDVVSPQVSRLSPYLHLGMVSPVEVALAVRDARSRRTEDIDSYLEELLVRRELTHNFVYFSPDDYDSFSCLPNWAQETLDEHKDDERPQHYTAEQLEYGETDDEVFNAAAAEVRERGYLHNQLRMYWGKRFLEWTNTPQYGYQTLLKVNNKYFLDGRDANSFANVAWIFGLHDRAFGERDVFGKVRYLSRSGLDRKFDTSKYVERVQAAYAHESERQS